MSKESKSDRIIVDTNIWISFLIGKHLKGLHQLIASEKIEIITCEEQVVELSEVFRKPKIRKFFNPNQIKEFFDLLEDCAQVVDIKTNSKLCQDPKDNYLLSLSIDSEADYLITGDNDLLVLKNIGSTTIISFGDFSNLFH